jgi:hypothetical protein
VTRTVTGRARFISRIEVEARAFANADHTTRDLSYGPASGDGICYGPPRGWSAGCSGEFDSCCGPLRCLGAQRSTSAIRTRRTSASSSGRYLRSTLRGNIDHERREAHPRPGRHVGDVGDPQLVGAKRWKSALWDSDEPDPQGKASRAPPTATRGLASKERGGAGVLVKRHPARTFGRSTRGTACLKNPLRPDPMACVAIPRNVRARHGVVGRSDGAPRTCPWTPRRTRIPSSFPLNASVGKEL